jgi:SAM-dependent methyltransferase
MPKRPFIRKQKKKQHGANFWDREYIEGGNLKLSTEESEDLAKFIRWLGRQKDTLPVVKGESAVDVGCGNGRNLVYLAEHLGLTGTGYDTSTAAIKEAESLSRNLPLSYTVRSIAGDLPLADNSQAIALDMMASHFLSATEREHLRDEIFRMLRPGGWLFLKTFLLDEDLHSERLLREFPSGEPNTYIHPVIGVPEHVYSEAELTEFLEERFLVRKVYRSHKHISHGQARKRRTISVYAEKDPYR